MWKHEIYHDIHGIYRYIPCMNRLSTNPKMCIQFFQFWRDHDVVSCDKYAWMYKRWKIPLKCNELLYVYTAIRIVYRRRQGVRIPDEQKQTFVLQVSLDFEGMCKIRIAKQLVFSQPLLPCIHENGGLQLPANSAVGPIMKIRLGDINEMCSQGLNLLSMQESASNHDLTLLQQVMNAVGGLLQKNGNTYTQGWMVCRNIFIHNSSWQNV